jgi:hypothetical protein
MSWDQKAREQEPGGLLAVWPADLRGAPDSELKV